ncbi:MAG TPA: DUF4375 domain-containing protein [Bacteroidia bacterium]|nr:DUF4375 domain-containing protein [Bacteroidia bacterium]
MKNRKLIDIYYKEAVKEMNKTIMKDKDSWYNHIVQLPEHLQVVYTIVNFHQQLFKGGFHLYFSKPHGQFAYLALENLWTIKAIKSFMILKGALNEVNIEMHSPDEFREHVFKGTLAPIKNSDEDVVDILDELDTEYYSLDEDIEELLANYLKNSVLALQHEQQLADYR